MVTNKILFNIVVFPQIVVVYIGVCNYRNLINLIEKEVICLGSSWSGGRILSVAPEVIKNIGFTEM